MAGKPLYFEIFMTSLGALLLEISYTRIFSFKVFYYFTYLILGMGLLGIGAGGIAVATSDRLRRLPPERVVPAACFAAGATVLIGYLVIAPIPINLAQAITSPLEIGKLLLVSVLLTTSFFAVGVVLSVILSSTPAAANRLYGVDLIGAALGCMLAVPLVSSLTPPRTVMLAGFLLAAGGLRLARESKVLLATGALVSVALAVPLVRGQLLRDPVVAESKQFEAFRRAKIVRYSKWSPVFRIDVADHPFHPGEVFFLFHDGQPGSGLRRFDGTFRGFEYLERDTRALPFSLLPPEPRVLIIGAAGGHEVIASLYFKAGHVTGVELNPATYELVTKVYADVAGHLAENPKVTLVNGDGRWFLKQSSDRYDLIWFVSPDSYAAMNAATSGAFVLSESYLYTVEMVKESLGHLSPAGVICTQFGEMAFERKPNRTARYLSTARAAFAESGLPDFRDHVLVASAPGFPPFQEVAVLLGKKAFTGEQIQAFTDKTLSIDHGALRYTPYGAMRDTPIDRAIRLPEDDLKKFWNTEPYQIDPVRDDAPFFWHFARFRDALRAPLPAQGFIVDPEDTIAEQIMVAFLGVAGLLSAVLLLLPLVSIRDAFRQMPHKEWAFLYFASIGLGFMFLEVALIQKLTLLLGYPTYSLSVTLSALLVFSGIGSLSSARWAARRRQALTAVLAVLALWVLAAHAALPTLIDRFVGSATLVRVAVAVALIAPVGLCLGGFMPLGLRTVSCISDRPREYVAWAWAVNGFFSVIASILSTILAMVVGFRWLLLIALAIYVIGAMALLKLPEVREREPA